MYYVFFRSRDYFRALSRGSAPLDKDRWEEVGSLDNHSGITVGLLRLLHKQVRIYTVYKPIYDSTFTNTIYFYQILDSFLKEASPKAL